MVLAYGRRDIWLRRIALTMRRVFYTFFFHSCDIRIIYMAK